MTRVTILLGKIVFTPLCLDVSQLQRACVHPLFRSTNTDGETSHSGSGDEMQLHVEHGGSSFSPHSSNINAVCQYLGMFLLLCGGYKEGSSAQIEPLYA